METRTVIGIIVGFDFALVIIWGAMYSALAAGGLVLLAAAVDGIMAGIGIGGLIGLNIALGAAAEEENDVEAMPPGLPKAA
jgi:hypothetical protein